MDTTALLKSFETYGQLDGEISYYYASNFSKAGWMINDNQKTALRKIRNRDKYPCNGAYLYSEPIALPNEINPAPFFASPK